MRRANSRWLPRGFFSLLVVTPVYPCRSVLGTLFHSSGGQQQQRTGKKKPLTQEISGLNFGKKTY